MEHDPEYTVTIRGETFILNKSQIEFDAPNYFTTCFLGDFREAQSRHLRLSRDPALFRIVLDYLCGYTILPLQKQVIPRHMSPATALENLRADAAFYQLDGLIDACDELIDSDSHQDERLTWGQYLLVGSRYTRSPMERIAGAYSKAADGDTWRTFITKERLSEEPFTDMKIPRQQHGYLGLRRLAAVEGFAATMIEDYNPCEWLLVGWHSEEESKGETLKCKLLVVLENLKKRDSVVNGG